MDLSPLQLENSDIIDSIASIFSSISTETKVKSIAQTLNSQYSKLFEEQLEEGTDKQQEHLKNFAEAKQLIQTYWKDRNKKGAKRIILTREQRIALQRMYFLYNSLKGESEKLSKKLQEGISSDLGELFKKESSALTQQANPSFEEVQEALSQIDWDQETIKTQNSQAWKDWNNNPFRHFYDSESEFNKGIAHQQSLASRAEYAEQMQERMKAGYRGKNLDQWEQVMKGIKKLRASTGSFIELQVGIGLLRFMGQF